MWGYGILGKGPKLNMATHPEKIPAILFGRNDFRFLATLIYITDTLYRTGKEKIGSGMGKKLGSGMNNPDHISVIINQFFGLKYLNSLMRIRDQGWEKFGSGINIPEPQPLYEGQLLT